jgi:hypothetical protein
MREMSNVSFVSTRYNLAPPRLRPRLPALEALRRTFPDVSPPHDTYTAGFSVFTEIVPQDVVIIVGKASNAGISA